MPYKQPVTYSDAIVEEILARLAEGETLRHILKSEYMPDNASWLQWVRDRPDLAIAYSKARLAMFYAWADELVEMADDSTSDWQAWRSRKRGNGEELVFNREHVERTKLKIETRKWLMRTLAAAHFGDGPNRAAGDSGASVLASASGRELVQTVATYAAALGCPMPPDALHRMLIECGGLEDATAPALPRM